MGMSHSRGNWWRHARRSAHNVIATPLWGVRVFGMHVRDGAQRRGYSCLLQLAEEIEILFEITRHQKLFANSLARFVSHLIAQSLIVDQLYDSFS